MGAFFKSPRPTQPQLQQQKKWNDQFLNQHRSQLGKWAEEQRKKLKKEIADTKKKVDDAHRHLEHIVKEAEHAAHEDHVNMHFMEEMDHWCHELHELSAKTHEHVSEAQHTVAMVEQPSISQGHEGGHGGAHEGAAGVFQLVAMLIILLHRIKLSMRRSAKDKAKAEYAKAKSALNKLDATAKQIKAKKN